MWGYENSWDGGYLGGNYWSTTPVRTTAVVPTKTYAQTPTVWEIAHITSMRTGSIVTLCLSLISEQPEKELTLDIGAKGLVPAS